MSISPQQLLRSSVSPTYGLKDPLPQAKKCKQFPREPIRPKAPLLSIEGHQLTIGSRPYFQLNKILETRRRRVEERDPLSARVHYAYLSTHSKQKVAEVEKSNKVLEERGLWRTIGMSYPDVTFSYLFHAIQNYISDKSSRVHAHEIHILSDVMKRSEPLYFLSGAVLLEKDPKRLNQLQTLLSQEIAKAIQNLKPEQALILPVAWYAYWDKVLKLRTGHIQCILVGKNPNSSCRIEVYDSNNLSPVLFDNIDHRLLTSDQFKQWNNFLANETTSEEMHKRGKMPSLLIQQDLKVSPSSPPPNKVHATQQKTANCSYKSIVRALRGLVSHKAYVHFKAFMTKAVLNKIPCEQSPINYRSPFSEYHHSCFPVKDLFRACQAVRQLREEKYVKLSELSLASTFQEALQAGYLHKIMDHSCSQDFEPVIQQAQTFVGSKRDGALSKLADILAKNPRWLPRAMDVIRDIIDADVRAKAWYQLICFLKEKDPDRALDLIDEIPIGDPRRVDALDRFEDIQNSDRFDLLARVVQKMPCISVSYSLPFFVSRFIYLIEKLVATLQKHPELCKKFLAHLTDPLIKILAFLPLSKLLQNDELSKKWDQLVTILYNAVSTGVFHAEERTLQLNHIARMKQVGGS